VPYGDARAQANQIAADLRLQAAADLQAIEDILASGTDPEAMAQAQELKAEWDNIQDKKIIALIAYIQRLGTDLFRDPSETSARGAPAAPVVDDANQGVLEDAVDEAADEVGQQGNGEVTDATE
jgi:hypothetical protein